MKTKVIIQLLLSLLIVFSCTTIPESFTKNKSVIENDVIYADDYYYSQAVTEFEAVRNILMGMSKDDGNTISLFGKIISKDKTFEKKLLDSGFLNHEFQKPKKLEDLNDGFQFKQYFFSNENKAALNAFGIANSSGSENINYLVIDYLQYKDITLYKLPTLRYAVGVRAELKIYSRNVKLEAEGIGSLAGLAMSVENKKVKVDISMKTIGITGLEARVPLPENNNFDVSTYADFKGVLTFIKTMKDRDSTISDIRFNPQLIPVLDKYRSNTESSIYANIEKIDLLREKIERSRYSKEDIIWKNEIVSKLQEANKKLYEEEVKRVLENKLDIIKYYEFIKTNSSITNLIKLDTKVKDILATEGDTKPSNIDILEAAANQAKLRNDERSKELLNNIPSNKIGNNNSKLLTKKKILEKFNQIVEFKSEELKKERWLYVATINTNNKVTETIVKELKIGQDYKGLTLKNYQVNTDANLRDGKPIIVDNEYKKGNIIDILKENEIIEIKEIPVEIPGINNQKFIWVKIK